MKYLIWKEWRENFKWALIVFIIILLYKIDLVFETYRDGDFYYVSIFNIIHKIVTPSEVLLGLLLAHMQLYEEISKKDNWAFLLHRPISRSTIFFAKIIAGFSLYFFATLLPMLFVVAGFVIPGIFPVPYQYIFLPVQAPIILIIAGLIPYAGMFLIYLNRGKRVITSILTAVFVYYVYTECVGCEYFTLALFIGVAATAFLLMGAYGAMLSNGSMNSRPWYSRLCFFIIVGIGIMFILSYLISLSPLTSIYYDKEEIQIPRQSAPQEEYCVTLDDLPVKVTDKYSSNQKYEDLDGNLIALEKIGIFGGKQFIDFQFPFNIGEKNQNNRKHSKNKIIHDYYDNYVQIVCIPENEVWFSVWDNYFVNYSLETFSKNYIYDNEGFKSQWGAIKPFAQDLHFGSIQITQLDSVYYSYNNAEFSIIDFVNHKTDVLIRLQSEESPIYGVRTINTGNIEKREKLVLIATSSGFKSLVATFTRDKGFLIHGKPTTIPYQHDIKRYSLIYISNKSNKNHIYIKYEPDVNIPWDERKIMDSYLDEYDLNFNLIHSYALPPIHMEPPSPTTPLHREEVRLRWSGFIDEILSPIIFYNKVIYDTYFDFEPWPYVHEDWFHGKKWEEFKEVSLLGWTVSFLFSIVTYLWARKVHFSKGRALQWAVFTLFFNIAGLITFRLVSDWPVQVPCPHCKKKRPVHEDLCPHCEKSWPAPAQDGTEIFDSL